MRISDWSSDVCSSDLVDVLPARQELGGRAFVRFEAEVDADIERGIESHVARIQRLEIALAALHRLRVAAAEEGDAAAAEAAGGERRAAAAAEMVRAERGVCVARPMVAQDDSIAIPAGASVEHVSEQRRGAEEDE